MPRIRIKILQDDSTTWSDFCAFETLVKGDIFQIFDQEDDLHCLIPGHPFSMANGRMLTVAQEPWLLDEVNIDVDARYGMECLYFRTVVEALAAKGNH